MVDPQFLAVNTLNLHWGEGPLEPTPLHSSSTLDEACCLRGILLFNSPKIKHPALISYDGGGIFQEWLQEVGTTSCGGRGHLTEQH